MDMSMRGEELKLASTLRGSTQSMPFSSSTSDLLAGTPTVSTQCLSDLIGDNSNPSIAGSSAVAGNPMLQNAFLSSSVHSRALGKSLLAAGSRAVDVGSKAVPSESKMETVNYLPYTPVLTISTATVGIIGIRTRTKSQTRGRPRKGSAV